MTESSDTRDSLWRPGI